MVLEKLYLVPPGESDQTSDAWFGFGSNCGCE
jgi:hypothetical protein